MLSSIVWAIAEIARHLYKQKPVSLFFKFSATVTIIFGLVDLYLQQSILFKYEASLTSTMVGVLFALSLWGDKPIIREFAEAQGRVSKEISPDTDYYFKFLTVVWSIYFFAKAAFYFWVALHYSLEEGLIIRSTVGSATFYGLLAISIFGSRFIKFLLRQLRWLPSSRGLSPSLTLMPQDERLKVRQSGV